MLGFYTAKIFDQLTQAECDRLKVNDCVKVRWSGGNEGIYAVTGHNKSGHARVATLEEIRQGLPGMNYLHGVSHDPKLTNVWIVPITLHSYEDKWPYGIEVFAMMMPGSTPQDEDEAVRETTEQLNKWSRSYSGPVFEVVLRKPTDKGKVVWIVNPTTVDEYTAQIGALIMQKLRQVENRELRL